MAVHDQQQTIIKWLRKNGYHKTASHDKFIEADGRMRKMLVLPVNCSNGVDAPANPTEIEAVKQSAKKDNREPWIAYIRKNDSASFDIEWTNLARR